jgi:hypothetical protein
MHFDVSKPVPSKQHPYGHFSSPKKVQDVYVHYLGTMDSVLTLSPSFILTDENQQIDDDAIIQAEMARCNPLPLQRRKCFI